jgi:hypothetical protein
MTTAAILIILIAEENTMMDHDRGGSGPLCGWTPGFLLRRIYCSGPATRADEYGSG